MTSRIRIGALAWLIGPIVFLVTQLVAQSAWTTPYRWSANNVSDLGNVACQDWGDHHRRFVCSPWHEVANTGFVALGLLLILGAVLLDARRPAVRILAAVAGIGWVVAGLFPADVNENAHVVGGALLVFFVGNATIAVDGVLRRHLSSVLFGVIGLVASWLFLSQVYLGFGMGGMERVAAYPHLMWLAAVGLCTLRGLRARHGLGTESQLYQVP